MRGWPCEGEVAGADAVAGGVHGGVKFGAGDGLGFWLWAVEELFGQEDGTGGNGSKGSPEFGGEGAEGGKLKGHGKRIMNYEL